MKKLLFAVSCAMVGFATEAADLNIATVDVVTLVRNHPDYERNEKFMESKSRDLEKKGDAIKAEGEALQEEGRKLVEQMRNPMFNERAKADVEKKIQDIQQKLIQVEQRYRAEMMRGNQDLQEDRARLMKATTDDLRARLKKYGEENGYDLILDTNVIAYAKDSYDVTASILKEMGVDPEKVEKDTDESK